MKQRHWIIPVLALGLGLAGCAGPGGAATAPSADQATTSTAAPTPVKIPAKPTVDLKNPESVAAAFVTGAYSWDTTTDKTRTDALKRVASLATEKYAKDFVAPQKPSSGAAWLTASQHKARSVPNITAIPAGTDSEINPDATFRILAFRAEWTWLGQDDVETAGGDELATVTVDKDNDGTWHVSAFSTTDVGS